MLLQCQNVVKTYQQGTQEVRALRGVSLNLAEGEFAAVVGPSGSGKSTLLNLLGCLDIPTSGDILFETRAITRLSDNQRSILRNEKIGFIFQNFQLIPVLSAFENVEFALQIQGRFSAAERREQTQSIIKEVGLEDARRRRPSELSGGQQQRVAIARALVKKPRLVLADEPTANLDSKTAEDIVALMLRLNTEHQTTFLFSTHDNRVMRYARRILTLKDGQIEEDHGV